MHAEDIKRHPNGTIDIDFYREQAVSMRRESMTRFVKGTTRISRPLIAVAVLAAGTYAVTKGPASNASELRSSADTQFKEAPARPGMGRPI